MSSTSSDRLVDLALPDTAGQKTGGARWTFAQGCTVAVLVVSAILVLFPFVFMLSTATKTYAEFLHQFWLPSTPPHLDNFVTAWTLIERYLLNTVFVNVVSVSGALLFGSMSAYVFARHDFPGKDLLFMLILSLIMLPGILQLLPRFMLVMQLGLLNTYWALILPYISGFQAFTVFVLRTFIAGQPEELFEAARIDGANDFQIYARITLPLAKAILGTLAIVQTRDIWNDLIWPLIVMTNDQNRTISAGLAFLNNPDETLFGALFASYVIASLPLLVLFAATMKQFMAGLTSGALKL